MQESDGFNLNFKQPEIPYNSFPRRPIFLLYPKRINSAKTRPSQHTHWQLSSIKENKFTKIAFLAKSSVIQDLAISHKSPLNTLHFCKKNTYFFTS
jgi:hypothetical protein